MKTKAFGSVKEILEIVMEYVDGRLTQERPTSSCVDEWIVKEVQYIIGEVEDLAEMIEKHLEGLQTEPEDREER